MYRDQKGYSHNHSQESKSTISQQWRRKNGQKIQKSNKSKSQPDDRLAMMIHNRGSLLPCSSGTFQSNNNNLSMNLNQWTKMGDGNELDNKRLKIIEIDDEEEVYLDGCSSEDLDQLTNKNASFLGPHCRRCRNHSIAVTWKGHKKICPFRNCPCDPCRLINVRKDTEKTLREMVYNTLF